MPSLIGESVGRIVVAIDPSGWIGSEEIGQFLGAVRNCGTVRPDGIDLLYWDMEVCQHEKYDQQDQLETISCHRLNPQVVVALIRSGRVDSIKAHKLKR